MKFLSKYFWVYFQSVVNFDNSCQFAFSAGSVSYDLQADKHIGNA